jgi:hypothetical protein
LSRGVSQPSAAHGDLPRQPTVVVPPTAPDAECRLARQQEVCREQDGKTVFVTGMDAAREYLIEHVREATPAEQECDLVEELRDVLCCVSQIFNGWRPCEEWSKWDEEVAQRVIVIQRRLEPVE